MLRLWGIARFGGFTSSFPSDSGRVITVSMLYWTDPNLHKAIRSIAHHSQAVVVTLARLHEVCEKSFADSTIAMLRRISRAMSVVM
jgi:hypothetical protein